MFPDVFHFGRLQILKIIVIFYKLRLNAVKHILRHGKDETIKSDDTKDILRLYTEGRVDTFYVVCDFKEFETYIHTDDKTMKLKSAKWYHDAGLTTRNPQLYVHRYSDTDNEYGLTVERTLEFEEEAKITISNETETDQTILYYVITGVKK